MTTKKFAIHVRDRIAQRAGFLHVTDDLGITGDVGERRIFDSRKDAEATLARLRGTPLHWLTSQSFAATIVETEGE